MSVTQTRGCGTPPCGCTAPCVALFSFYEDDFDRATLLAQLQLFRTNFPVEQKKTIHDIVSVMQGMSVGERAMLSEVVKLVRLLLVMPATNTVSERSFSAMRRIKTYLRSTMLQERLNAAMTLHIHKDLTDSLDLKSLSNDFVAKSDYRKSKFPMYESL